MFGRGGTGKTDPRAARWLDRGTGEGMMVRRTDHERVSGNGRSMYGRGKEGDNLKQSGLDVKCGSWATGQILGEQHDWSVKPGLVTFRYPGVM
ncbi:hypothetical protein JCM24511_06072 [Saitozyma sp. JCM 24511]|nr:hypothetical protein JCM24511_06072 [Saitozyma sp. JCM 24511]